MGRFFRVGAKRRPPFFLITNFFQLDLGWGNVVPPAWSASHRVWPLLARAISWRKPPSSFWIFSASPGAVNFCFKLLKRRKRKKIAPVLFDYIFFFLFLPLFVPHFAHTVLHSCYSVPSTNWLSATIWWLNRGTRPNSGA